MKEFDQPIPQEKLNIVEKTRSNLFTWRGQFSPQLIEVILSYYCLYDSVILDPFVGSGTVLREAGNLGLAAYGFEVNPAALILSKTYELINNFQREEIIKILRKLIDLEFPFKIFESNRLVSNLENKTLSIQHKLCESQESLQLFEALIILLDIKNNRVTNEFIQCKFFNLQEAIKKLPYSEKKIRVSLSDARSLPLKNNKVDFVITSPPYINVFNYHQNYRKSAEMLGWNVLKIARSEIGSNRANRANRFYTVIQYCLDIAYALKEISRVAKCGARVIFIIGYESTVLGVPFYNSKIIEAIIVKTNLFHIVLKQKREFKNKFGKIVREDLINCINLKTTHPTENIEEIAREISVNVLRYNISFVSTKNSEYLENAIAKAKTIKRTPILDKEYY
ncbi:MAG: DNA methyltransferase [Cyanobacteriota bacterium]|nr:DNA methyltransferase [Cyanobacteriota bacterium]